MIVPNYFFERTIKIIIKTIIEIDTKLATITEGLCIIRPYESQLNVPEPITRYIVNDKPSAVLDFQIL